MPVQLRITKKQILPVNLGFICYAHIDLELNNIVKNLCLEVDLINLKLTGK